MKFLCDVHISIKLVKFLISKNHDCIHVNTILENGIPKIVLSQIMQTKSA